MSSYFVIGYKKNNDENSTRYYVENIYKQSVSYDSDIQDALRIPDHELATGIANWLKRRDEKAECYWFVAEQVTTENLEML